jgi:hypothetical protein
MATNGTEHPKLPPASPAPCAHEHLQFASGTFVIQCIDCRQKWMGVVGDTWTPNLNLQGVVMYPPRDTRHDRWVLARTEPLVEKPAKKPLVKK